MTLAGGSGLEEAWGLNAALCGPTGPREEAELVVPGVVETGGLHGDLCGPKGGGRAEA